MPDRERSFPIRPITGRKGAAKFEGPYGRKARTTLHACLPKTKRASTGGSSRFPLRRTVTSDGAVYDRQQDSETVTGMFTEMPLTVRAQQQQSLSQQSPEQGQLQQLSPAAGPQLSDKMVQRISGQHLLQLDPEAQSKAGKRQRAQQVARKETLEQGAQAMHSLNAPGPSPHVVGAKPQPVAAAHGAQKGTPVHGDV